MWEGEEERCEVAQGLVEADAEDEIDSCWLVVVDDKAEQEILETDTLPNNILSNRNDLKEGETLFQKAETEEKANYVEKTPAIIKCFRCNKVFQNIARFSNHIRRCKKYEKNGIKHTCGENNSEHSTNRNKQQRRTYACSICSYSTVYKQNYRDHMEFHKQHIFLESVTPKPKPSYTVTYKCDACRKVYKDIAKLKDHLESHTFPDPPEDPRRSTNDGCQTSSESNYCCECCGKLFSSRKYLNYHMTVHTPTFIKCKRCPLVVHRIGLYNHMQWHKKLSIRFQCKICGKGCHDQDDLEKHAFTHIVTMPAKCKECGHIFTTYKNAREHANVHDSSSLIAVDKTEKSTRTFTCRECDAPFVFYCRFIRHLETVHGIIKSSRNDS